VAGLRSFLKNSPNRPVTPSPEFPGLYELSSLKKQIIKWVYECLTISMHTLPKLSDVKTTTDTSQH
jgi:hypothetical protein